MKLGGLDLPDLPALALPRLPLAAFRRRIVFHGVFVLLAVATLALALTLLAEEKQRSRQRYEAGFRQTLAAVAAQLRSPTGQLALLNADPPRQANRAMAPLVLPYSALDFDDPFKARQAVETSGCAVRWADGTQLCAAVGSSAYAGGFIYLVASLNLPPAQARERGQLDLLAVHRARISVSLRGVEERWTAPFEAAADGPVQRDAGGLRGRLTGFAGADDTLARLARPDRDFRGWLWQDAECADRSAALPDCLRSTLLSIRVPIEAYREALFQRPAPVWPPRDLAQVALRLQWLGPDGATLFDSDSPGAVAPFSLADLAATLSAGEVLRIDRVDAAAPAAGTQPLAMVRGRAPDAEPASPWLTRLILRLPTEGEAARRQAESLQADDSINTAGHRYRLVLTGDLKSVDRGLGATATRLSWFIAAMLAAIAAAWLVIELGFMRRVAVLTKRAAALSYNMQDPLLERRLGELEVADLRGRDELGILAGTLAELLRRVKDGVRREHIRAEQERDMWQAVGHEIMSPLQSLMVLHGQHADPSRRYVQRMQQAVRVLYGTASPSEAIASAPLQLAAIDLNEFLAHVSANAPFAGIENVQYEPLHEAVPVQADEHSLEDAVTHVLRNADRHRQPGTAINLSLAVDDAMAQLTISNIGAPIEPAMLERIFEYGVSEANVNPNAERRGQGLFVARTYMAKMGGTITARNDAHRDDSSGSVSFVLTLPRNS